MRNYTISVILAVCTWCGLFATDRASVQLGVDSVVSRMDFQRYIYPQEKIHVTINQGSYVAGDTIWLRAWVVDAASHRQVAVSRYVYAELISSFGTVDSRIKVKERDGVYQGYIPLPEDMPEGAYTLTAYTGFMESAGSDYFFRKSVRIISPYSAKSTMTAEFTDVGDDLLMTVGLTDPSGEDLPYGSMTVRARSGTESDRGHGKGRKSIRINAKERSGGSVLVKIDNYSKYIPLPQNEDGLSVTFHPEGGYVIPDQASRIGIKAIDTAGRGVDIKGRIVDSQGKEVSQFSTLHRGMGEIVLVAQPGEIYTAEVDGRRFEIPVADPDAAVLHVDNSRTASINVSAVGNVPDGAVLVVLNRGRGIYSAPVENGVSYRLPRDRMGTGVVQFMLLDSSGNPLSERQAFVYPDSLHTPALKARVLTDAHGHSRLTVAVPENMNGADVAVAVLDRSLAELDSLTDIRTHLLLQSDLRGHIEDPGFYFRNTNRATAAALDALMLTQGWSRYDVPLTLRGHYSEPSAHLEQGMEISGLVKSRWKGKPLAGAQINVLGPKAGYAAVATTGDDGRFSVCDTEWPEGVKFVVQALDRKGRNEHNFEIDPEHFPTVEPLMMPLPSAGAGMSGDDRYANAELMRRISRINGRLNIALGEVTVRGRNTKKPEDIYEVLALKTFRAEDIEKEHMTTYEDVLRKIPGLILTNGLLSYRNKPVEFWIDGMRWIAPGSNDVPSNLFNSRTPQLSAINQYAAVVDTRPGALNSWQAIKGSSLKDFQSQYPFTIVKRLDFIPSTQSMMFNNAGLAVVNIISQSGNAIPTPPDWRYKIITPLGYQPHKEYYNPAYELIDITDCPIERSTIYWLPSIEANKLSKQQLTLPSANVSVLIEGLTSDGNIISVSL